MPPETPAEPPLSVGDCIGQLAVVPWRGKEYKLSAPTPTTFAALEQWVAADVFAGAKQAGEYDPGALAEVRKNLAARHYRVGGPYWDAVMGTPDGGILQLWGMVAVNHPAFTIDDARAMSAEAEDAVELALLLAAPDFFTAAAARANAPPGRAEAGRARVVAEQQKALAGRTTTPAV